MSMSAGAARLKRTIEELLAHQRNDLRLRDHLEGMRRDEALPGLTWFWGPELYRRNRVVFREFILAHFSEFEQGTPNWRRVKWDDHADRLDPWLARGAAEPGYLAGASTAAMEVREGHVGDR